MKKFFTVSLGVPLEQDLPQGYKGLIVTSLKVYMPAITKIGNQGIGEYGNGKRYRYAVCGITNNHHIQVYSQKIKGIPHGI